MDGANEKLKPNTYRLSTKPDSKLIEYTYTTSNGKVVPFIAIDGINKQNCIFIANIDMIYSSHAYTIVGYNENTKYVQIANPHSFGEVTEIPIEILHQYLKHLDFLKL